MPKKKKFIIRECKTHGDTQFVLEGRGYYRCRQCRMDHVTKRRKKVKAQLVEEFGGKCVRCGYNKSVEALQFHHTDPKTKSFGISHKGVTRSYEKAKEEASKCDLLCANCHAELHADN